MAAENRGSAEILSQLQESLLEQAAQANRKQKEIEIGERRELSDLLSVMGIIRSEKSSFAFYYQPFD